MRLALVGPITGMPDHNTPAFAEAAEALRAAGYEVANPRENFDGRTDLPWTAYLRASIKELMDCDGVAILDDWFDSTGAKIEAHIAEALYMPAAGWRSWVRRARE